jgi:tetratricopeptide (TPR) repeat protein
MRSRYPGTQPFGDHAEDYARFFGRDDESEQLYLRILSVPLLVQFGTSGMGKTSLLQAGVFPRLRSKPFLPIMIRLNDAASSLTEAVARSIAQSCSAEGIEYTERAAGGLWELLSTTFWRDDLLLTPVLVFDQFEEVFTLRDPSFRRVVAAELGALASGIAPARVDTAAPRPTVKIVISLREDYLGALEEFSASIPGLFQERLRLEPFTEEAARAAIVGPAQLQAAEGEERYTVPPFTFDAPTLQAMIDYLKGSSGVIEPFQLQLLCRNAEIIAFQKARAVEAPVELTLADFQGGRGFGSVLEDFYRDTLHKIASPAQRRKAQVLAEEGLLGASGHRLMLEERQILNEYGLRQSTLDTLARERLVRRERRLESVFYEVSHDRLAESIYKARRNKLPRKWRRALWAGAIAALIIVGGMAFFSYRVQRARNRAEGLLGFLLGEQFLGDVRDVGRSSLLELVQNKVEQAGSRADFNRGLAFRNRGDVQRSKGELKTAVQSFREALAVFENGGGDIDSLREAARTHDRLGWAYYDEGDVTNSLRHYEAASGTWRRVIVDPAQPELLRDDCTSLADSLVAAADVNSRMGRANVALAHVEEALSVTSNILFGPHGRHDQCGAASVKAEAYPDAKTLEVLSRAALSRASVLYFHEDYEGAAVLAVQARWLRPLSVSARQNERLALLYRALDVGNEQRSLEDCRAALAQFDELRRWDPANLQWVHERAVAELLVAYSMHACLAPGSSGCSPTPSLQEAEAAILNVISTLRGLGEADRRNQTWETSRAWALEAHAAVLKDLHRDEERLSRLQEAERIYHAHEDGSDAERMVRLGRVLRLEADTLEALGRKSEAAVASKRAIELFTTLVAAHPDNPTFVASLSEVRHEPGLRRKYEELTGSDKRTAEDLDDAANRRVTAGQALLETGDVAGAFAQFREAENASRQAIELGPAEFTAYRTLYAVYAGMAGAHAKLGQKREDGAARTAAMNAAQMAAWLAPENTQNAMSHHLFMARAHVAEFLDGEGRIAEELALAREVVTAAEPLVARADRDAVDVRLLGAAKCSLGKLEREERRAGWEEAVRSGLVHLDTAAAMDPRSADFPKSVGYWRRYLAEELVKEKRAGDAARETALALSAYRQAAALAPADAAVQKAIRDLGAR